MDLSAFEIGISFGVIIPTPVAPAAGNRTAQQRQSLSVQHYRVRYAARATPDQPPNLSAARALAFATSLSRFFGGAFVSSERRRRVEIPAISSTAARNDCSLAFDGLPKPLIFLTNWSE